MARANDTLIQTDKAKMITTRPYSDTIIARIKREPKFAQLLYASAINAILEGETAEGLSILRDIVHAETSFKELARQTGLGEKSLHRILNHNGNPTARNPSLIVKSIAEDLGIKPRVKLTACP
jgi:DNA-binding phage protein